MACTSRCPRRGPRPQPPRVSPEDALNRSIATRVGPRLATAGQGETGLTPRGDLAHQVVFEPDRVSALAVAEVWWELIQLMVSDLTIGETAPGVAPDWLGQIRQGLQHRYRGPSTHSNYGANHDQPDDTPSPHIVCTCSTSWPTHVAGRLRPISPAEVTLVG